MYKVWPIPTNSQIMDQNLFPILDVNSTENWTAVYMSNIIQRIG